MKWSAPFRVSGAVPEKSSQLSKSCVEEIVFRIGRDDLGVPGINEGEGATRRADIHRLPQAI